MENILNEAKAIGEIKEMLQSSPWGYAYHKILLDEKGRPEDYEFLHVNRAFEEFTGLKRENLLGHRVTEVLPGIEKSEFDWIGFYGRIALEGGNEIFEQFSESLEKWYKVQVFSSGKGYFATLFVDITSEKERAEELENFFAVNPDLLCIADIEGNFVKNNRAWEGILGYTAEELQGRRFLEFVHPDDLKNTLEAMGKLEKQEDVLNFVNRYRTKNGTYRFIEWRSRPVGKLIFAAARDVTEERRIFQKLQDQREQFQLALRGTDDGIWDWDIRRGKLFFSEHWKKMLGYEDRELPDDFETFPSLLWEEDRERVLEYMESYLREEVPKYSLEFRMKHKDGSLRWILSKGEALRDEKGLPYRMVGSHSDITERKKIELQLARERERLSSILEGTRAGTWEWNVQTGEIALNERWAEMLGYALKELEPLSIATWTYFSHPEDLERSEELLEKHFRGELEYYENEVRMRHREGRWIWVQDRGKVARWTEDGKPLLISGTHQDITERKENEERLKSSEENFRAFFETMDDLIIIGNRKGDIFYANPAVTEKLGYAKEDLRELNAFDLWPETERNEAKRKEIVEYMLERKRNVASVSLKTKKGLFVPVESRMWFGRWNGKEALFSISKDISKEREALQKFNKLFESNPALMTVTDASNLKVIDVNQAFMNALGYSREEVIGKTDMELNLFVDSPDCKSMKEALRKFGSVHNMDLKLQNKSREIREGLFSAEVIESQGKRYYLSVMIDITERKRAEREVLLQSKMQSLLTHIAKACINMPLEGMQETVEHFLGEISQFMRVQRAYVFEYYWDRRVASVLYEWCENGVASQKENFQSLPLSPISAWIEAHLAGKSFYVPDILALPEDSNVRQTLEPHDIRSLIAVPMLEGTECLGFVSFDSQKEDREYSQREQALLEIFAEIMVNLKIRRTLENRLVEEKDKALTASKAKSEFLANMSHEIRTPLNGVIGFTDLLRDTPLSPIQEQYVRNANASGHALLGIVSDILDFSKIEAGKLELEIVKTDLIDLVEQSVSIVRYGADQKKVEVLLDLDLTMPRYAFVDPVRLKQVLANLLSNAVKFTEKGEVALKVRCSLKEPRRGVFSFYVRDTGIGIEEKEQKKLFRAFSQADGSTTRRFGGTGLGLAISDSLVRQMGGVIELRSIPDRGSTFFFSIEASCEEGERADRGHIEGISRVLVIDDNANNRLILENMLAHWGIEFVGAEDIPEALKILKQAEKSFDVLIVDYHMPYLDGLEGIRMVRDNLKLSPEEQPVILLHSSSDDAELSERCRKLGVRFRLIKPIHFEELFAYLSSIREEIPEEFAEKRSETFLPFIKENDRITVAIAEDDSINRILVSTLVQKFLPSARILEAHTGREAVNMAKRDMPDLLFMDVQMPEMDGNEATRRIREDEGAGKRHLPIVGLTAGALESEREKSLEAGMDAFLTKPIEITKFQEVLKKYVDSLQKSSKEKEYSPSEEILHFDAFRLVQELGDSQALKTLVGASRVVLPKMLEFLEKSLEKENMKDLVKAVSTIGRSASVMHFLRLQKLTDSLETFCAEKSCNFGEAEEMVLALRQEWNFLATLLERESWKEYR